jgi:DNA-binding transcriptional ArsR family regulator
MVQHLRTDLDDAFAALADGTRRGVLEQLGRTEASITELAARFDMTLTGMKKHVRVLEDAGLVTTQKVGRVRTCRIGTGRLEEVAGWVERYQQLWDARFSALDDVVEDLKSREKDSGSEPRHGGTRVGLRDRGHPDL